MEALEYVRSLLNCDFESFNNFIDPNCEISYNFNGQPNICNGEKFVSLLKKGHFENTIACELIKLSIERIKVTNKQITLNPFKYKIIETTIYDRKGLGRDEDGPGKYKMYSEGIITFANKKIIQMEYSFIKEKIF